MCRRIFAGLLLLLAAGYWEIADAQITEPKMLTRKQWEGEKIRVNVKYMVPHGIAHKGMVIHHTQISQQLPKWNSKPTAQKMRDIQAIHQKNLQRYRPQLKGLPWADFAYHYFIDINGEIAEGRDPQYQGDSGTNYDMAGLLLVVLQGDFRNDRPTAAQLKSLDALTTWLATKYHLSGEQVTAHNDHASTDCPGPNLKSYLPQLKEKIAAALRKN